jgi:hypothetical protein
MIKLPHLLVQEKVDWYLWKQRMHETFYIIKNCVDIVIPHLWIRNSKFYCGRRQIPILSTLASDLTKMKNTAGILPTKI